MKCELSNFESSDISNDTEIVTIRYRKKKLIKINYLPLIIFFKITTTLFNLAMN